METDLTTIIISIIALSFFFIPILIDQRSRKKGSKKIDKQFLDAARKRNLKVRQHDVWRDSYAIGIDTDSKKLFYMNMQGNENEEILIDLSSVKKCRFSKTDRSTRNSDKREKRMEAVDRVRLILTFHNPGQAGKSLEFFDGSSNRVLQEEVLLAQKWVKIINSNLSKVSYDDSRKSG